MLLLFFCFRYGTGCFLLCNTGTEVSICKVFNTLVKKVKKSRAAVNETPSQSCGMSLAVWHHQGALIQWAQAQGPRATITCNFFYCGIINKMVQFQMMGLNIESTVRCPHNTFLISDRVMGAYTIAQRHR